MLFSSLEAVTDGELHLTADIDISKYTTDTRTLLGLPTEVFIAIRGFNRDGHDFVKTAYNKGIRSFILEREVKLESVNVLVVDDTIEAFQKIAAHHRNQHEISIFGITGSNGKTTVKEWLSTLLSQSHYVVKSPKSFNSQIGVPLSVVEIKERHEVGVFEAGISKSGEMVHLQKVIQPTIGIFTTFGAAHDDGFKTSEEKLIEKLTLFVDTKRLICRKDVPWFSTIAKTVDCSLTTWSLDGNAVYQVDWTNSKVITINDQRYKVSFEELSSLENATHAIIGAIEFGLTQEDIQNGLDQIKPVSMRLELKQGINGCYLLDDTYNNDLIGLKVAMDYLDGYKQNKKKTLVLSDILHSNREPIELYSEVAELVKNKGFHRLIGVGPALSLASNLFPDSSTFYNSTESLLKELPEFRNEMILFKGARDFQLEKVVKQLEAKSHGTVLEVNFESLRYNLNQYRGLLKPNVKLMVMVKANAYGSGIAEVSNFLQHEKVDYLGVAYVDEAIQLRNNGIDLPIMIMNPHISSFSQFERYNLQAEIFSISHLNQLINDISGLQSIHLKIDTGMHRLGFSEEQIPSVKSILKENPNLKVESIFTHFSSSDDPSQDNFTIRQAQKFEDIYQDLTNTLGYQPLKHAVNSPGMVRWPQYHYDMVRLGIGLHGFDPTNTMKLRPGSQLKSVISQIQELEKGATVGYSRKGILKRDSKIAIVPLGYEDGFLRVFGNGNATILINGKHCPTVGNICMDMMMVDVTDVACQEGDEVLIFGSDPTIATLAEAGATIPYEILTNVSSRVKRVFVSE